VRSPFGEELWDYTEYSPSGEIISREIGTTIRATGQHVIVTREREVDENGEPTGEWEQTVEAYDPNAPDPDDLEAAQIGEIFGSQLGSLIAGDNPFAQVLAGSALATVLGNIGGAISYFNSDDFDADDPDSLSDDLDDVEIPEFSNFFQVLKGQAVGAVSGFLAAELGEALGVEGFGGQLFTTVASRSIGYVLGTVADNIFFPAANWNGDIFAGMRALGSDPAGLTPTPFGNTEDPGQLSRAHTRASGSTSPGSRPVPPPPPGPTPPPQPQAPSGSHTAWRGRAPS
jgi:hypothetical protein